jgi:hypothetical protein
LADRKPLLGCKTIDLALDREDRVDVADRFSGEWRFAQISQLEEFAPTVAPACRLGDRARFALGVIEIAKPGISIGRSFPAPRAVIPADRSASRSAYVAPELRRSAGKQWRPSGPAGGAAEQFRSGRVDYVARQFYFRRFVDFLRAELDRVGPAEAVTTRTSCIC